MGISGEEELGMCHRGATTMPYCGAFSVGEVSGKGEVGKKDGDVGREGGEVEKGEWRERERGRKGRVEGEGESGSGEIEPQNEIKIKT